MIGYRRTQEDKMVTPTNGTATFQSLDGMRTYQVDFYISDVVASPCTLTANGKAGTGSLTFWKAPENVVLTDLSIASGPTVMVGLQPTSNDAPIPNYNFRIANFLNSIQTRPRIRVGFKQGNNVGLLQF